MFLTNFFDHCGSVMWNLLYIVIVVETFLLSMAIVPSVIRLAQKQGVLDKPGKRKVHSAPKPLMGGVAIFSSFFFVIVGNLAGLYLVEGTDWFQHHFPQIVRLFPLIRNVMPRVTVILIGGLMIHLLGLVDDIFKERISYKIKFMVQGIVAILVAVTGVRTHFMPTEGLDIFVTSLWIIGMTNGFNLLDNLDGLTAGVSIISALLLFGIAVLQGQIFFAMILIALVGSCFGFLCHNFYPSRLFMGDSGSLFLGYMFGTLTVMGSYVVQSSSSLLPVVMPILILSIPLYDTFSVMFIRWREGRPLFLGDKRHFSHRLLELGMSHRGTVIFIYLVSLCVGSTATLLPYVSVAGAVIILVQAVAIYTLITILIATGRRSTLQRKNKK
jgi:UDP-GlcNAc:undecaprenyl-phosphate GlcNAc-1-phosphate transferase